MPDTPAHLIIGRILRPHGVRGEVKVEILTDFPERLGRQTRRVYLGEELQAYRIRFVRSTGSSWLIQFAGVSSLEEAEELRGQYMYIRATEAAPLEAGEYYHYQIVGLEVYAEAGDHLGRVTEVLETGANDVYVVQGANQEILLPAIADVIREVDLPGGRLVVQVPEGLL